MTVALARVMIGHERNNSNQNKGEYHGPETNKRLKAPHGIILIN